MDYPYLDTVIYDNFYEMLKGRYETVGNTCALRYFEGDRIVDITYCEMIRQIACMYQFLAKQLKPGQHIGILSENRYEYIIVYLASVLDHVIVPLDKELDAYTIADCVKRFDVDILVVTDKTKGKAEFPEDYAVRLYNLDERYADTIGDAVSVEEFFRSVEHTDKDRFSVLASTSGTDGAMKGVMLSQYNVITNIRGTLENNVLKNPTLAFLPMNHTYGFNPCMLATLYNGTTLCLNLKMKYLMRDIKAFDPYFFGAVPMVIEGMYENIMREIKRQKKEKTFARLIKISNFLRKIKIDVRHLFFGKIISRNLRLVVNGGAALNPDYVSKYDELGISILNGYGMTECSPTVAVSRTGNNVIGSAGTIMKHIDVKIAEDGEILVKGPNVMLGYYKDEQATKACMHDGYYASGDIGYTDGKVIFVTGRKKNLIISENGKNVPPEYLEEKINHLSYVKESLIVAKTVGRSHILLAKIVLNDTADIDADNGSTVDMKACLEKDISEINQQLPDYMHIDEFEIMDGEFEKNSSKKIIRKKYMEE